MSPLSVSHCVFQYSRMHKLDPVQNQIQCLKSDIKQLQADGIKAPPQSLAEAAVHTENFITSVAAQINFYTFYTCTTKCKYHVFCLGPWLMLTNRILPLAY